MVTWSPDPEGDHGQVFTRRWVVDFMLDAVGYEASVNLADKVVVEPSCGCGAFILPIVERLIASCKTHDVPLADTDRAIRAFDLLEHNAEVTRKAIRAKLLEAGESESVADRLAEAWVTTGDFLLTEHPTESADFVIGNPPYIRLEDVPAKVSDAYRSECGTMRGRADVYVGFFEKGLAQLKPEGKLAFICADRWMHNQYGSRLREFVSDDYAVDSVVVMHDVDAFEEDVSAYPAVTIVRNGAQKQTRMLHANVQFDSTASGKVLPWVKGKRGRAPKSDSFEAGQLPGWFEGPALWPSGSPKTLALIADLEARFAPLEDEATGTRVGIGVASGCDRVYIPEEVPDVEDDRLLPLIGSKDISSGQPQWSERYLVNPWKNGSLVDLAEYPKLAAYYEKHGAAIKGRHVAKKRPATWHRTIDKVDPKLQTQAKLLLPDMKAAAHPVLDRGQYYPHHNLYFVVSRDWDLEVLGGLLLSDFANLFVGAYCVKMRGGTYRFQAQYLRKIRVPNPAQLSSVTADALRSAFAARDAQAATEAACNAYGVKVDSLAESTVL